MEKVEELLRERLTISLAHRNMLITDIYDYFDDLKNANNYNHYEKANRAYNLGECYTRLAILREDIQHLVTALKIMRNT